MEIITEAEAIVALADGKSIISDYNQRPIKIIGDKVKYIDGCEVNISNLLNCKNLRIYKQQPKEY